MSIGISVNKRNNGLLLSYIAHSIPNIHLRKLLKIVYLMDEHFMKMRAFPLTWFDYYVWAKGPVAPEIYDIKNGAFREFVSTSISSDNKCIIRPVGSLDLINKDLTKAFTYIEIEEINILIEKYGNMSVDELSDLTHKKDSLWSNAVENNKTVFDENNTKSEVQIDFRELFKDNQGRKNTYEQALRIMKWQEKLNANKNPNKKVHL